MPQFSWDPSNWYWDVIGVNNQVFSSASFNYVSLTDTTYLRWLSLGNVPTITSQTDLSTTMTQSVIPLYLGSGLQVTSNSNSALNATYALDPVTLSQVGAVAVDVAAGLGFPQNVSTFSYPDIIGTSHTFNEGQFTSLYVQMRNYIATVQNTIANLCFGYGGNLPPNTATIT